MNPKVPDTLEQAPLAYENDDFLNSPEGRMLRIMAEYQEPMSRFRRERIQDTVVFFGSARFRALDVANSELELLANTGSTQPAPEDEQPATMEEIQRRDTAAVEARRSRGGDGSVLRGRSDAGWNDGLLGENAAGSETPVCGDFGWWAGDYGGGES